MNQTLDTIYLSGLNCIEFVQIYDMKFFKSIIVSFQLIKVDQKRTDYPDYPLEKVKVYLGINNSPMSHKDYYQENVFHAKRVRYFNQNIFFFYLQNKHSPFEPYIRNIF